MTQRLRRMAAFAALAFAAGGSSARADNTFADFLKATTVSGNVRAYDFNRIFSGATQTVQPSQSAFSIGGRIDAKSASFLGGFSIGLGLLTAHSLGLNDTNDDFAHLDATLAGRRNSITALGQAYLQYANDWLTVRAGDQIINTPWLNDSDSRLLPATYQGVLVEAKPVDGLRLSALRVFRWKSRTSNDYFQNNLYYAPTYGGDDLRGGTGTGLAGTDTQGVFALGTSYVQHGLKVALWYYAFQQTANMLYNDSVYTLKTGTGFDPFAGGQFVREWKSDSLLNGAPVNTVRGSGIDNRTYGLKAGLNSPVGQFQFSYTNIAYHGGAVGNGALVSPYTVGYTTDPIDTSSIIRGVVDLGPGHAWKFKYSHRLFGERLQVIAAFARYYSYAYGNSNNALVDLAYYPQGALKGFSIRNRLEDAVAGTPSRGLNPGRSKFFIYDRVQLQYEF